MEKKDSIFIAKWKIYVILAAIFVGFLVETEILLTIRKRSIEKDSIIEEEKTKYTTFEEMYENLEFAYQFDNTTRMSNLLATFYEELRNGYGPTGTVESTTEQEGWEDAALFASYLAMHDIGDLYWPSIDDRYYNLTGEHTCDTADNILRATLGLLEIKSYDPTLPKIEKILSFLDSYITYEDDIYDTFHAPVETLSYRTGDCDDFSILCAAILEKLYIESAIGSFTNDNDEWHVMVLVNLDSLFSYTYYSFSDLTSYGLDSGQWIIIEPQLLIQYQHLSSISQWNLVSAAELDYP